MSFTLFGRIRVRRCKGVPGGVVRHSMCSHYSFWEQRLSRLEEFLAASS